MEFLNKLPYINNKAVFVFKGAVDPETGLSWCEDCNLADAHLKALSNFCEKNKIDLLQVSVGVKEEWKSKDHPLRKHPKLKVGSIPTIGLWDKGAYLYPLSEGEILDKSTFKMFLEQITEI